MYPATQTQPLRAQISSVAPFLPLPLQGGLEEIACMVLSESVEPGNICIEWQTINDTVKP